MKLSLPVAVLLGLVVAGALVAGAIVYTAPRAALAPSAVAKAGAPLPVGVPPAPPSEAPRAPGDAASAHVTRQIEARIVALARACWSADAGDSMQGAVDLTFDAEGNVLTHGVKESLPMKLSPGARPATLPPGHGSVMACIDAKLGALRVDAPAARVATEVPFTLP